MEKNIYKKVSWKSPILPKKLIPVLLKKNNTYVLVHVLTHLSILFFTSALLLLLYKFSLILFVILLFFHGMVYQFLGTAGASHELYHNSPFTSKRLNIFFYFLFSFLLWNNPIIFSKSHKVHHRCSIHSDCDGEIDPNQKFNFKIFIFGIFNLSSLMNKLKFHFLNSVGIIKGDWVQILADDDDGGKKFFQNIKTWSRCIIIGHASMACLFIIINQPILILIVNFGSFFGNLIAILLAMGQHNLMPDKENDFRKNSRTIIINPIIEFFYWGMNYHIEHSMFPKIPFYNLKKVRSILKEQLPYPTIGIYNLYKILKN